MTMEMLELICTTIMMVAFMGFASLLLWLMTKE